MTLFGKIARADARITRWMAENGIGILRASLGIIFFWFGFLKFFPGLSPARDLAAQTIEILSLGYVPSYAAIPALAAWECAIGIGLIVGKMMRLVLLLLFVQMAGTLAPVFVLPREVFTEIPYAPTLEGQYIFKNIVLIAAAIVIGGTLRNETLGQKKPAGRFSRGGA